MAPNQINPKIIEYAQKFKQALNQSSIKADQVILFGSHVNGTAKIWSDIDIGVVSPNVTGLHLEDFPKLRRFSEPISLDIEPHGLTPAQYNSPENGFAAEIKKTGIVI